MIKIITDSTAYIPEEFAKENDITIIPLTLLVGDVEYEEGFADTFQEIYNATDSQDKIPTTSQPSPSVFSENYEKIIKNGDEAIVLTISSELSGTYNTALRVKYNCSSPDKISVIDSETAGHVMYGYVIETIRMIKEGKTREEIVDYITLLKKHSEIEFVPDTFSHLKKGGRIGKVTAIIGSILHIKPILCFRYNKLISPKKTIGAYKAMLEMVSNIPEEAKTIFVIHIRQSKFLSKMKEIVFNKFPNTTKYIGEVGPVVGAHVGPAVGVAWISE